MRFASTALTLASGLLLGALPARGAGPIDWNAVAQEREIEILTTDEDGSTRETTVWLAVQGGQGYIRTSGSRWLANIERDPDVVVRIAGEEYALRAVAVTDPTLVESVVAVFRAKYGTSDAVLALFRSLMGAPTILRLDRPSGLSPVR